MSNQTEARYSLSCAQEAFWLVDLLNQLQGESMLEEFVLFDAFRVPFRLDSARLSAAVSTVTMQHEVLRSALRVRAGCVEQHVQPFKSSPVHWGSSATADADEVRAQIDDLKHQMLSTIKIAEGDLFGIGVLDIASTGQVVVIALHHLAGDDLTLQIVRNLLADAYDGRALDPIANQYGQVATDQRAKLETIRRSPESAPRRWHADIDRWHKRGASIVPLVIPGTTIQAHTHAEFGTITVDLAPGVENDLRGFCNKTNTTMFMVSLAAFHAFLGQWVSSTRPTVMSMRSIRAAGQRADVGLYVDPVLFVAELDDEPTFQVVTERCRDAVFEMISSPVPFVQILAEVPEIGEVLIDPNNNQLVVFQYLIKGRTFVIDGVHADDEFPMSELSSFPGDMGWWIIDGGDWLKVRVIYRRRCWDASEVTDAVSRYADAAQWLISNSDSPISDMPLLHG